MIDATELQEQYHLDPFDHDGFVVSVKRNLVEAEATALHPDGEFICRAVRRHRSLAKMGYWLAASAVIALGLIGMIAGLSQTSPAVQGLVTLITVVYLIVVITLAVRFAPHSAVVLLLDESERADALPALVLKRSSRLSVAGDVSALMAEGEGEIGRVRRFGANSSSYSLFLSDAPGSARFVPERKVGTGAVLASVFSPFGFLGALVVFGQPADSWKILQAKKRVRLGSLVKQKSALGDYVLDLTDDLDRELDRRALTLIALAVVLNRTNAK
ncbi:MAG: hypothetical protein ACFHWZ_05050 [Phycisphaerales bacterium]